MAAPPHRDGQPARARESNRGNDVGRRGAPRDQGGLAVDQSVVDPSGLVIACLTRPEELSGEALAERRGCVEQVGVHDGPPVRVTAGAERGRGR
jgi:hypothetical protein